jgi:hypothetical protein
MRKAASLLCAAAVGALLFSIHVATSVFRDLPDDRLLAGRIAGRAFTAAYAIAAVAALVAVVVVLSRRTQRAKLDRAIAVGLLSIAALQSLWVAPAIVRHGAGWPGSFASLHATGGVLHLALVVLALLLSWRLLDETPAATGPGTTSS